MKANAILFTGVEQLRLTTVDIPEPGPGEVLVEALYTLISPGTELRCRAGRQEGTSFPFIPGYSMVGRVVARGPGATLADGTPVFCSGTARASEPLAWGGHCALAVQAEAAVHPLPDGVDPLWGAAAKLAAIAYRGVRLANARPHETVAVIGLGVIGQCSARLHALTGARVLGADLSAARVAVARAAGIEAFVPQGSLAGDFAEVLPGGADVVVDSTGAPAVLAQALAVARDKPWDDSPAAGARIVVQGSYPDGFTVPYQAAFMKELSLWVPRDVQPADIRTVLGLMARGRLSLQGLVSEVRAPEAAAQTYAELADPSSPLMTVAFQWSRA